MDGDRAALWVHGHMHESFDYEVYGTRVVCNPRGYAPNALNPDFRSDWVVDICVRREDRARRRSERACRRQIVWFSILNYIYCMFR